MSRSPPSEAFPQADYTSSNGKTSATTTTTTNTTTNTTNTQPRRRRRSSGIPGDPIGDTETPALATLEGSMLKKLETDAHSPTRGTRGHKRRKAKTLFRRWARFSLRYTWVNPLIVCLAIISAYALNPTPSNPLRHAIFLSYPIAGTSQYGKGGHDFTFVAFYTIFFSFLREFIMQQAIRPLAIRAGMRTKSKQFRFMEQAYSALYTAAFSPLGLYVMYRSPVWYFNTTAMYEGFPHRQHEGIFKAYYLLQAAFWLQQAIVLILGLEKPRKDYKEFVLHHVVTIALIWCSYRFHFAYMGVGVFFTHDISDFFLASSKMLNYIDHPYTGPYFAFFILVWAYTRHYLSLQLIYSVLTTFRTVGPFELNWETQQYKCWISQWITFTLLASLQGVNLFWFWAILRIAKRYAIEKVGKDDRSVDEEEDEEDETTEQKRERLRAEGVDVPEKEGMGNGSVNVEAPRMLLNGVPIEDGEMLEAIVNGHGIGNGAEGVKKVEVKARQRTLKSRKA